MRADQLLGVHEHAHGRRIVIAEHAIDPLAGQQIGIDSVRLVRIVDAAREQCVAGRIGLLVEESAQSVCDAALLRQAAEIRCERALPCLGYRELTQPKECRTRRERDPVRVAAPGVQHHPLAAVLGKLEQRVLQLERAQAAIAALLRWLHGATERGRCRTWGGAGGINARRVRAVP